MVLVSINLQKQSNPDTFIKQSMNNKCRFKKETNDHMEHNKII